MKRAFSTLPSSSAQKKIKRFYKNVTIQRHPAATGVEHLEKGAKVDLTNLSKSHEYWSVALDKRTLKTMYKDELLLPSRALAAAVAQEWESQHDVIDLRTFHINNAISKGVRASHDLSLVSHM